MILRLSWAPPALYLVGMLYVRQYDGWGRWAAAPILLPALISSAALGVLGGVLLALVWRRERRLDRRLLAGTLLGSSVVLYLGARSWML